MIAQKKLLKKSVMAIVVAMAVGLISVFSFNATAQVIVDDDGGEGGGGGSCCSQANAACFPPNGDRVNGAYWSTSGLPC